MPRSSTLGTAVTGFLLAFGLVSAALSEELPDPTNIGFVIYAKSYAPGTLIARWMFTDQYKGSGIATGGPKEGYAGRYHVRYFYDSGEFSDAYDLVIEKSGDDYKAYWLVDGAVKAFGVGVDVGSGLAVGWRRATD